MKISEGNISLLQFKQMSLFKQLVDEADEIERGGELNSFELLHYHSYFENSPNFNSYFFNKKDHTQSAQSSKVSHQNSVQQPFQIEQQLQQEEHLNLKEGIPYLHQSFFEDSNSVKIQQKHVQIIPDFTPQIFRNDNFPQQIMNTKQIHPFQITKLERPLKKASIPIRRYRRPQHDSRRIMTRSSMNLESQANKYEFRKQGLKIISCKLLKFFLKNTEGERKTILSMCRRHENDRLGQNNIKRRIYDSLNVMSAVNALQKAKNLKKVKLGQLLIFQRDKILSRIVCSTVIQEKRNRLKKMIQLRNALAQLRLRNLNTDHDPSQKIYLPIIIAQFEGRSISSIETIENQERIKLPGKISGLLSDEVITSCRNLNARNNDEMEQEQLDEDFGIRGRAFRGYFNNQVMRQIKEQTIRQLGEKDCGEIVAEVVRQQYLRKLREINRNETNFKNNNYHRKHHHHQSNKPTSSKLQNLCSIYSSNIQFRSEDPDIFFDDSKYPENVSKQNYSDMID